MRKQGESKTEARPAKNQGEKFPKRPRGNAGKNPKRNAAPLEKASLFRPDLLDSDAKKVLEEFDSILYSLFPLNSKQKALLPKDIAAVSHQLTDERGTRRLGYMNSRVQGTAYMHYFLWWNLIRMTRLFAGLGQDALSLQDGDACVDIGSGPLTVPLALWLARPELRRKKLTWYCLDLSAQIMADGEEVFLAAAARSCPEDCEPWKIVRVRGEIGTPIREKAALVCCANTFNELLQAHDEPPEFYAKKFSKILSGYSAQDENSSILLIEPGIPQNARLISLMRDALIRAGFPPASPCPHCGECPMDGRRGKKWCNLAFDAADAPKRLRLLSEAARLKKERAVLSFLLAQKAEVPAAPQGKLRLRIASDPIRLPGGRTGFYACSERGLILADCGPSAQGIRSGDLLEIDAPDAGLVDEKSGAALVRINAGRASAV